MLEDSSTDAEIVQRLLKKEDQSFQFRLSVNKASFLKELQEFQPDLVLADNALPQFNATEALQIVQQQLPHTPFIMVTGTVSEEFAAAIIKKGADDYVLKDRLARLPTAIAAARKHRSNEKEKNAAAQRLQQSEEKYRTLVEHAFDGIIIYTIDGAILDCNHSTCNYLGFTQEELKQMNVVSLFFKEDLVHRPLYFETLKAGHSTIDYRRLRRKDGTDIEMEIGTKMMPDGRLMAVGRDITERKKAAEQQALFASIVNSSDDAILSTTKEGIVTSWNRGAELLFNYTANEMMGHNISIIVPPEYAQQDYLVHTKAIGGEYVPPFETQRRKKNGSLVHISLSASPVKNNRGGIMGVSKIARDITERKESEQKIIQSEANLKAIFDNSVEGFILTDTEGLVKAFNNRAAIYIFHLFTKKIETGSSIFEFTAEGRMAYFKQVFAAVLRGETIKYDRSYVDTAGKTTWIAFAFTPVKEDAEISGVCITADDITDKKNAEQQREFDKNNLDALINNTTDLMWSVDRDGRLITFNKACEELVEQLTGKKLKPGADLFALSFSQEVRNRYQRYYKRAFTGEAFTEQSHNTEPFEYWAENSFYPIYEGGAVIGTACFSRDITARKMAEGLVRKSFEEKHALAVRMAAILNTLPANIALLNDKGDIIDVNDPWKNFADDNGYNGNSYGIGDNYIAIAATAAGEWSKEGPAVAKGIKDVIEAKTKDFIFEYPCHSPKVKRWFRMIATPLRDKELAGAVVMHIDISELRKLEQERLKSKMNEQKKITRAMLQGQENERNQLGQELHDNISQLLAAIRMKLSFHLAKSKTKAPLLTDCIANLEEAVAETRNLSHRMLMPRFKESSFTDTIKELAKNYTNPQRKVQVDARGFAEKDIAAPVLETLYRIAQEQLHNIEKHAKADAVNIALGSTRVQTSLLIEDNGVGFDSKKKKTGVGLTNIMNRAESFNGQIKINTEPGKGCRLLVEIPLRQK